MELAETWKINYQRAVCCWCRRDDSFILGIYGNHKLNSISVSRSPRDSGSLNREKKENLILKSKSLRDKKLHHFILFLFPQNKSAKYRVRSLNLSSKAEDAELRIFRLSENFNSFNSISHPIEISLVHLSLLPGRAQKANWILPSSFLIARWRMTVSRACGADRL